MCMLVAYLLRNGWTDLAKLFLLAPSWSRDGFRPKKFRIRDPVFPEIRKNPNFENFEDIGTFRSSYKIDHNSKTDELFEIFFASMVA